MKMVKSLILGSAAALVAVGGAQAADLPVKAKAVEYVKVCSLYGPGFYYIPGTDTCIKLGGYLRVETLLANANIDAIGNYAGQGAANNRFTNGYTWRSREDFEHRYAHRDRIRCGSHLLRCDLRPGPPDSYGSAGNGSTIYSPDGRHGCFGAEQRQRWRRFLLVRSASTTPSSSSPASPWVRAVSQFAAPWAAYPGNGFDGLVGGIGTITGVNQFSYTAQFGNGVSLSLSAEDQTAYMQGGVN